VRGISTIRTLSMRDHFSCAPLHDAGCTCGLCGSPSLVAFSGKRQFLELLNIDRYYSTACGSLPEHSHYSTIHGTTSLPVMATHRPTKSKIRTVPFGQQSADILPPDWPFPPSTEIWVCPSTSGAAALPLEVREAPYAALAQRMAQIAWPRSAVACLLAHGSG
jgi:thymine-DNA glycosylase